MNLLDINNKIKNIKSTYPNYELNESFAKTDPFEQFVLWFDEALQTEPFDPSAMVLATTDENGVPDARMVLLKELEPGKLVFFSNYNSKKARHLAQNKSVAINFYWPNNARQVRIKGTVEKTPRKKSEDYFASRPKQAQIGAHAWIQSTVVSNRDEMEQKITDASKQYETAEIPCPDYWGGYIVTPFEYEFFQGRNWRLHDRLLYTLEKGNWKRVRLTP